MTNAGLCAKLLDFKRTHANNGLDGRVGCPSLELNPAGLMLNSFCKIICVCGLIGMLWPSHAASQPENTTRYAPLGQVLPRATQESGVQFQTPNPMLKEEVPVRETGPNRNLNLEPVLDEFSRIELFGDDSELKKVIIMNRNTGASSQAPAVTPTPPRNPRNSAVRSAPNRKSAGRPTPTPQSLPTTNLSKEQLQTLIRGAYRSPLPENLWDDPAYREFLAGQGITSQEEMKDRNKAKNVRKNERRMLWKLKNKS
jgi:hypothetical protein